MIFIALQRLNFTGKTRRRTANYACNKFSSVTRRLATIHLLYGRRTDDRRQPCYRRLQHSCSASINRQQVLLVYMPDIKAAFYLNISVL